MGYRRSRRALSVRWTVDKSCHLQVEFDLGRWRHVYMEVLVLYGERPRFPLQFRGSILLGRSWIGTGTHSIPGLQKLMLSERPCLYDNVTCLKRTQIYQL